MVVIFHTHLPTEVVQLASSIHPCTVSLALEPILQQVTTETVTLLHLHKSFHEKVRTRFPPKTQAQNLCV